MPVGRKWQKHTVAWSCAATSAGRAISCASELERPSTFGGASPCGPAGCASIMHHNCPASLAGWSKQRRTRMPASIQASAISHIALCVRDLERSLQFYRDGLGFQVTKDEVQDTSRGGLPHLYHDSHARRRVVHLRYGEAQSVPFLVLTEHPGDMVSGTPIMLDQVGISHVSFTVPNVEAVT